MGKVNQELKVLLNVHKRYCTMLKLIKKSGARGEGQYLNSKHFKLSK